jgi:hypothetical protein
MEMDDCIGLYHCMNLIRNACIKKKKRVATATKPLVVVGKQESQLCRTVEISPMLGP